MRSIGTNTRCLSGLEKYVVLSSEFGDVRVSTWSCFQLSCHHSLRTEAMLKKAEMKTSLVLNKKLLYSTGNYTQYFVITYKETEFEKEYVYIYKYIYIYTYTYIYIYIHTHTYTYIYIRLSWWLRW